METTDILIIGASFSGLTLGHHLPKEHRATIIDRKTRLNTAIESTGLITEQTKKLLETFCDPTPYIPNAITTIGVVSPNYENYFFSHTEKPWIYSTDTPELVKHLAETLPSHVEVRLGAGLVSYEIFPNEAFPVVATYVCKGEKRRIAAKIIVGADGSHSTVAKMNKNLSKNKHFLAGFEKVFYGDILLGDHPDATIYHIWFGEFSLGYGGWLSPTIINDKKAFRIGLAKLEKDVKDIKKLDEFIQILQSKNMIHIDGDSREPVVGFGHLIPIGGVLPSLHDAHSVLVGDAAGFCGAFAADGIKGAIVSGKVVAELLPRHLAGDVSVFSEYRQKMQSFNGLMTYYQKQVVYRWLWDRMKTNRTFQALFSLIEREKESFLYQFCDSKDKHRSLLSIVLRVRNIPGLVRYGLSVVGDMIGL
jgi:flavin-dependent dehydrogenase